MLKKAILFLIVLQLTFEQNTPKITIKGIQDPSCSNELGRINYKAKINYSDLPDQNSYFLLNLKDSNDQKRPSICKISKSNVGPGPYNPDNPNTDNPDQPDNPDQTDNPDIGQETDGPNPETQNPDEESANPDQPTVPIFPIPNETEPISLDDLKKLMDQLRENLEDKLNDTVNDIENLDDVNDDLKDILNFNIMKLIKKIDSDLNEIFSALIDFQDEKIVQPLNDKINELVDKLYNFDLEALKIKLNETVCNFKILTADNIEMSYIKLKKLYENLKKILDKIPKNNIKFLNFDLKPKLLELLNLIKQYQVDKKELLQKNILDLIQDIKQKIIDFINNDVNKALTKTNNNIIANLLYVDKNIQEIEDVIRANGTAIDIAKKTGEKIEDSIEKIEEQLKKDKNLKPIIEKIIEIKKDIKEDIKDLKILDKIETKKNELENYFNNLDDKVTQQIKDIIYKVKGLDKEQIKEFLAKIPEMTPKEILEELKKLLKLDEAFQKIKDALSKENFDNLDNKILDKIKELKDASFLEDSPLKNYLEKLGEIDEKIKKEINGTGLEKALDNFYKTLADLSFLKIDNLDQVKETFYKIIDAIKKLDEKALLNKLIEIPHTKEVLGELKSKYIDVPVEELKKLLKKLDIELDKIPSLPKKIKDEIKIKINDLINKLEDKKLEIKEKIESEEGKLKAKLDEYGIPQSIDHYIKSLKDLFNIVKDDIKDIDLKNKFNLLKDKLDEVDANLLSLIEKLKDLDIKDLDLQNLQVKIKTLLDNLKDDFNALTDAQKKKILDLINDLKANLLKLKDKNIDLYNKIVDKLKADKQNFDELINESGLKDKGLKTLESIKDLIPLLMNLLGEPGENPNGDLYKLINAIKAQKPYLTKEIFDDVQKVLSGLDEFKEFFKDIDLIDENAINQILLKVLPKFEAELQKLLEKYPQLKDPLLKLQAELSKPKYQALQQQLITVRDNCNDFLDALLNLVKSLELDKAIVKDIYKFKDKCEAFYNQVKAQLDQLQLPSIPRISDLENKLDPKVAKLKELFNGQLADSKKFINDIKEKIKNLYNDKIKFPIADFIDQIENSDLVNGLKIHFAAIKEIKDALNALFKDQSSYTKEKLYLVLEKIKAFDGKEILEKVYKLPGLTGNVRQKIKDFLDIETKIENLKVKIENGVLSLVNEKEEKLKKELQELKDLLDANKFLDSIDAKIEGIKQIIGDSGIKPSILDHIMAIKNVVISFKDSTLERNKKLINSLYEIRDGILDLNATSLILKLNSSVFDVKDDFINNLVVLVEKEDLIEKIQKLKDEIKKELGKIDKKYNEKIEDLKDELDKFKEKIKNSKLIKPIKAKIIQKIDELKLELDKAKDLIKDNDIYKKGKKYVDEAKEFLVLVKEDINNNDFITLNEIVEDLNRTFTKENIETKAKEVLKELQECDYEFSVKLGLLDNVKNSNKRIKNAFNNLKTKQYIEGKIDDQKEKIKDELEKLKNNFDTFLNDDRFTLISEQIKKLKEKVLEIQNKIEETNIYKINVKNLENNKEKLKSLQDKIKNMSIKNLIYDINQKGKDFQFKAKLKEFNKTKNEFIDEWNNYVELENIMERIDVLFKERKNALKIAIKNDNQLLKDLTKKIGDGMDEEQLNKFLEKIDKLNEYEIVKIDKNLITALIEELIKQGKKIEEKIDNFPSDEQSEEYDEALKDLSDHLKKVDLPFILKKTDKSIKRHIENLNLTYSILKGIVDQYENGPTPEVTQNLSELINEELNQLKDESKKIIEDSDLDKIDNPKLSEVVNKMKEDLKKAEEKIKDFVEENKDKNLDQLKDNLFEKLKEFNEKHIDKTPKERLEELKEAMKKVNDRIEEFINKEELKNMIGNIENPEVKDLINKLIENVKSVNNNSPLKGITDSLLNNLEILGRLRAFKALREIKAADIDYQKEVENIKRLKELSEEMQQIYDSSPLMNLIGRLITKTRVLEIKEKKIFKKVKNLKKKVKKVVKKLKKLRKLESEAEITCKIDDYFSADTKLTAEVQELKPYLLNIDNYDLSLSEPLDFIIQKDDTTNCNSNKIADLKSHLVYKYYDNFKLDESKNRLTFDLYAREIGDYSYPDFFYTIVKTKLANGKEINSYCLLEDRSNKENVKFNCYGYPDNLDNIDSNIARPITELESNYLYISNSDDSDSGGDDPIDPSKNGTNSYFGNNFYRNKSSGGLSAGAIVAIILASLVVLIAIIAVLVLCNKRGNPEVLAASMTDSRNNLQVPPNYGITINSANPPNIVPPENIPNSSMISGNANPTEQVVPVVQNINEA